MAEYTIENTEFKIVSKYSEEKVLQILENVAKSHEEKIATALAALSPLHFFELMGKTCLKLLKQCGTTVKVAKENAIRVTVNSKGERFVLDVTVNKIFTALGAVDRTYTLRGFAKSLSIFFATSIEKDVEILEERSLKYNDKSLTYPGGSLVKKLKTKVKSHRDMYYLTDAFDESLIPAKVLEILSAHVDTIKKKTQRKQET